MKWKAAVIVLSAALIALLAGLIILRWRISRLQEDTPAVVLQIHRLKQIVTVRYSIQRIVSLTEQKVPVGAESILLMVQGEALGGIDLDQLSDQDVSFPAGLSRTVMITLPPAKLTDVFLDEKQTKVWDRHVTWWTPWVPYSTDLESRARLRAMDDVRAAALQMGILQQARLNGESAIRDLLAALHMQVTFAKQPT